VPFFVATITAVFVANDFKGERIMGKKKGGTIEKVAQTVKDAARAVAVTADEYVVSPVGRALGLKKARASKQRPTPKSRTAAKAGSHSRKSARSKPSGK
jgi:hypothetical protein